MCFLMHSVLKNGITFKDFCAFIIIHWRISRRFPVTHVCEKYSSQITVRNRIKYCVHTNNSDRMLYVMILFTLIRLDLSFVCLMFVFYTWNRRLIT